MSPKFQIVANLENDGLHLQMLGEFDGSAAYDLIKRLEEGAPARLKFLLTPPTFAASTRSDKTYLKTGSDGYQNDAKAFFHR